MAREASIRRTSYAEGVEERRITFIRRHVPLADLEGLAS